MQSNRMLGAFATMMALAPAVLAQVDWTLFSDPLDADPPGPFCDTRFSEQRAACVDQNDPFDFARLNERCAEVCGDSWAMAFGSPGAGLPAASYRDICGEETISDLCDKDHFTDLLMAVQDGTTRNNGDNLFELIERSRNRLNEQQSELVTTFTTEVERLSEGAQDDPDRYRSLLGEEKQQTIEAFGRNIVTSDLPGLYDELGIALNQAKSRINDLYLKIQNQIDACSVIAIQPVSKAKHQCHTTCYNRGQSSQGPMEASGCCCYNFGLDLIGIADGEDVTEDAGTSNDKSAAAESLAARAGQAAIEAVSRRSQESTGDDFFARYERYRERGCQRTLLTGIVPTFLPTTSPTPDPTHAPTPDPTTSPTPVPTPDPTHAPTPDPTTSPTPVPTDSPTNAAGIISAPSAPALTCALGLFARMALQ